MTENKQTLIGHLKELRNRLSAAVLVVGICTAGALVVTEHLLRLLTSRAPEVELIYTSPTEMIGTYMKLSLYAGIAASLPFVLYQVVMFVAPALTRREKGYLYSLLPAVLFFFAAGVAFAYFVLLPPSLSFLLTFGAEIARPMISVESYVSLIARILFWTGIAFELPLVMYILSKVGVVQPKVFSRYRKHAVIFSFVAAAIITPTPDPINQTLVAACMIGLYEVGIIMAKVARLGGKPKVAVTEIDPN